MPESNARYLHEQVTSAQNKHAYFLLVAAASAIALAMRQTEHEPLTRLQIPLGLATCCWGLSFYFGCRRVEWTQATLGANFELSLIQSGEHPMVPPHPDFVRAAAEGTRQAADTNAEGANRNAIRQFRLLIGGAIFYVAWHLLEMAARTPSLREVFH